jgi:hypothetical protein
MLKPAVAVAFEISWFLSCGLHSTESFAHTLIIFFKKNISRRSFTQGVPVGKVNILVRHSIGHSKQKSVYVHVSYSERFPR